MKSKREERKKKKAAWQEHKKALRRQEAAKRMASYPLEMVEENAVDRPCGECQGCCMAVGVHEINKPMWTNCEHQCDKGCGIYKDRPPSCRTYYCLWQAGILKGEDTRPDKLGIILDFRTEEPMKKDAISAWELWEGAADQPRVMEMLKTLGQKFVILLRRHKSSKRRIIGRASVLSNLTITEIS